MNSQDNTSKKNRWVVGVTGASGMPYATALIKALSRCKGRVHVIISSGAEEVMRQERCSLDLSGSAESAILHDPANMGARPASGSWIHSGMVICPCSMSSLAAIANGHGSNLVHRSADVCLKEKRPLILVPRETPLSRIHLKNMLAAQEAGAVILPPVPQFYNNPRTIDDIVNSTVSRILDQLGVDNNLAARWGQTEPGIM